MPDEPVTITVTLQEQNGDELHINSNINVPPEASHLLRFAAEVTAAGLAPLFDMVQSAVTGQLDPDAPQVNENN